MEIWAKITFNKTEDVTDLIRIFFKDFNPKNYMKIEDNEAEIKIIFDDKPPTELIEIIGMCRVHKFDFGGALKEEIGNDDTTLPMEKNEEGDIHNTQEEKKTDDNGLGINDGIKKPTVKKIKSDVVIPELEELAKKSKSFANFVKQIAEWLELEERKEFFENLAIVTIEVDAITWKKLDSALEKKGIVYREWDKTAIRLKLKEKLANPVKLLPFLSVLAAYKNYSFENVQINGGNTINCEKKKTERVKLECFPGIVWFEEKLGKLDKTQPLAERVIYVLNAMGLEKIEQEQQQQIIQIANVAIKSKEIDLDAISAKGEISNFTKARMTFYNFIENFLEENGHTVKVKVIDFLKELQKVVINEGEIEN